MDMDVGGDDDGEYAAILCHSLPSSPKVDLETDIGSGLEEL